MKRVAPAMSVGVFRVRMGVWRFQNDGMRNANSQTMRAGKKKSRSFFLVSSMSERASCSGLRCSQEQIGAGSSGCEDQQQFHVGMFSGHQKHAPLAVGRTHHRLRAVRALFGYESPCSG